MSQVLLAVLCLDIYCLITEGNSAFCLCDQGVQFFGSGTEGKTRILSKSRFLFSPTGVTISVFSPLHIWESENRWVFFVQ